MSDTATTEAVWSTLVPVMVGGAIGLVGGWLGPWLVERRKEIAEKKKRRIEKFEELVAALFEYEHWLDVVRDMQLSTKATEIVPTLPPSPFAKLHAISAVHFPEFETKIFELEAAGNIYQSWMVDARSKKVGGEKDYIGEYLEVYQPFVNLSRRLLVELRKFAQHDFK
jgi:hypothetical protein